MPSSSIFTVVEALSDGDCSDLSVSFTGGSPTWLPFLSCNESTRFVLSGLVTVISFHPLESQKKGVAVLSLPLKLVVFGALEGRGCSTSIVQGPSAFTSNMCFPATGIFTAFEVRTEPFSSARADATSVLLPPFLSPENSIGSDDSVLSSWFAESRLTTKSPL